MAYLTLKSKVVELCDYRTMDIGEFIPDFKPDEEKLQKDIARILAVHGTRLATDTIENGDTVTLSCKSENPKFNKRSVAVIVGKGLFNRELEAILPGMSIGETADIRIGEDSVSVCILSASRLVLPELNNSVIASWHMENVETVEELKKFCINKQIDKLLDDSEDADMASALIGQRVLENTVFRFDEEEQRLAEKKVDEEFKQASLHMSQEDFGFSDKAEANEFMKNLLITGFKNAVIGNAYAAESGGLVTESDYETEIDKRLMVYEGKTRAEIQAAYTPFDFIIDRYSDVFCELLDRYVADTFKKALNP